MKGASTKAIFKPMGTFEKSIIALPNLSPASLGVMTLESVNNRS
jgi:hypothetical protein